MKDKPVSVYVFSYTKDFSKEGKSSLKVMAAFPGKAWTAAIVEDFENEKRLKRLCKTKTLFRLAADPQGQYRSLKCPYEPRGREWLAI